MAVPQDQVNLKVFRELIASFYPDPIEAVSKPQVDTDGTIRGKFQADNQVYKVEISPSNQVRYVEEEFANFSEADSNELDAADIIANQSMPQSVASFSKTFEPVASAIEASATFEELQDKVAQVYPEMSSETLSDILAQQMFLSDLAGRYEVMEETSGDD